MKSDDAKIIMQAIEENPTARTKLTNWERTFLLSIEKLTKDSTTRWITQRQSVKLQEIYRRVM